MIKVFTNFNILFRSAVESGALLIIAVALAIIANNTYLQSTYSSIIHLPIHLEISSFVLSMTLEHFVNELLMALFFFLVGMEIKREVIEGNLSTWSERLLPMIAAIAGVITPMLIFISINKGNDSAMAGWAIPTATDIAFALSVLAIFGKGLPPGVRVFLTALAIIDDLIAVIIIALFYTDNLDLSFIPYITTTALSILVLTKTRVANSKALYIFGGLILWYFFLRSGIHATVSGVCMGILTPIKANGQNGVSPLKQMENIISPICSYFVIPIFAFINGGINIGSIASWDQITNQVSIGIILGLFIGKQVGIFGITMVASKLRIATIPRGSTISEFYGVSVLCGIGFTMSIFISVLSYPYSQTLLEQAKCGVVIGSILSALWGGAVFAFIRRRAIKS